MDGPSRRRVLLRGWAWRIGSALVAGCALAACSQNPPKPIDAKPIVRDLPEPLRGTVGAEATLRGVEPVLVSGLGLVVGLNGTGGQPLPDRIQATMEREMALKGIGTGLDAPGTAIDRRSPRELLRDPNIAVVLVQAAIPPAAPANARFDVFVQAINASSLEGGRLWSTELRLGEATVFGAAQARTIATARGPIFINPFAAEDNRADGNEAPARAGVNQTRGRILLGGVVTNPNKIEVVMDNPSHSRAASIVSAINSRLPMGPGDREATAGGRQTGAQGAGPGIVLRVPQRYAQSSGDFVNLVRYMPIDEFAPEQRARRYVEALKSDPILAESLAWCLESIGEKALPFVRELYDYPEPTPRMAALRAGSRLGDPRAAGFLREIAKDGRGTMRLEAIALMARIDGGPQVDATLRDLLGERELLVRVAAYEALARRAERTQMALVDVYRANNPDSPIGMASRAHVEALATAALPSGTIQGVERVFVAGKFFLDVVPVGEPLVYVTQQGQPRIVVFGEGSSVVRPSAVSAWDGRFLMKTEETSEKVEILYRNAKTGEGTRGSVESGLEPLIAYLAQDQSPDDPRPGLSMSYSDVVGTLYAMSQQGAIRGGFATERDRLRSLILEAESSAQPKDRPETPTDTDDVVVLRRADLPGQDVVPNPTSEDKPVIVPIEPKRK